MAAGSMTKATASVGVSQPTLGRRMKALERQLGRSLFHRFPGHLEPTPLGKSVAELLVSVQGSMEGILRLAQLETARRVVVRLSASTTFSIILTENIPELVRQSGGASLDIAATRAVSSFGRRECDMAIRLRKTPLYGVDCSAPLRRRFLCRVWYTDPRWKRRHDFPLDEGNSIRRLERRPSAAAARLARSVHGGAGEGVLLHRLGEVFRDCRPSRPAWVCRCCPVFSVIVSRILSVSRRP